MQVPFSQSMVSDDLCIYIHLVQACTIELIKNNGFEIYVLVSIGQQSGGVENGRGYIQTNMVVLADDLGT
jgi:hypothetical protein